MANRGISGSKSARRAPPLGLDWSLKFFQPDHSKVRRFFLRHEQEPDVAMVYRDRMRKPDEGCEILRSESKL
jgi:hypothetical protein